MITMTQVAQDCCMQAGDDQYKLQYRMLTFCIRAQEQLNTYIAPSMVTHIMPVHANNTADLRIDCIKVWKVGIITDGRIITMGIDNTLSDIVCDPCPCETIEQANELIDSLAQGAEVGTVPFGNVWAGNIPIGTMYGIGAGFNGLGYYKEDYVNRRIILEPRFNRIRYPEIAIQQKVSGLGGSMQAVQETHRETLINFALWKHYAATNRPLSETYRRDFIDSRTLLNKLIQTHSLQQMHEDNLKNDVNAPKR